MKLNFWSRSNVCFNGLIFLLLDLWSFCFMLFWFLGLEVLDGAKFCVLLINLRLDLMGLRLN